eukprot:TRINITY_DN41506_c0_g1_i2.p1 TRINITY_DN41506_c0_g1~~TRINITY_DN41506_c0_g1_i2.p1  ORF type:complete len:364 (-),score=72.02 TRINITY_DN41506_c0_g1_i2:349-1371(-)
MGVSSEPSGPVAELDLQKFPPIEAVIGYGSGVFKQAGYEGKKQPMIDLVFVVEDSEVEPWHRENLASHPSHYSGLMRTLGASNIARVQQWGPGLYYNPHVQLPTKRGGGCEVKYGVVGRGAALADLQGWSALYLAGRLQKPFVLNWLGREDQQRLAFEAASLENRTAALSAALLLSQQALASGSGSPAGLQVTKLLEALVRLSYDGDIRVGVGEDPKKVQNIVKGQSSELWSVYAPLAAKLGLDTSRLPGSEPTQGTMEIEYCPELRRTLFSNLPAPIRQQAAALAGTAEPWNQPEHLRQVLRQTVRRASIQQTAKGIVTAGIARSARYGLAKFAKRLKL